MVNINSYMLYFLFYRIISLIWNFNFVKVIQSFAGHEVAPAWFAGAMANALLPLNARLNGIDARLNGIDARLNDIDARLNGIDARLDGMDRRIIIAEARSFNVSAHRLTDILVSPIIPPAVAAPAGFPGTLQELGSLSMANCNACMDAYGLVLPAGVQNTVANKRRLLTRFWGVRE